MEQINALGRRKTAVARVYVNTGKGNITINGKELNSYFVEETLQFIVKQPLEVTNTLAEFDIKVNLDGGGSTNMLASTLSNKKMHTVNSPTENRKVINAVGLTFDAQAGEPAGIVIDCDSDTLYKGESTKII